MTKSTQLKTITYQVQGMHCASCELILEKKLLELPGIKAVETSTNKNQVRIFYKDKRPSVKKLNKFFKTQGYVFFKEKTKKHTPMLKLDTNGQLSINKKEFNNFLLTIGLSLLVVFGLIGLNKSGFTALLSVNSQSSLPAFFIFGLLAGFSTCAALVGGIILSMSKQWSSHYLEKDSTNKKLQPHIMFNFGRIISFVLIGVLLGLIGQSLQISPTFTSFLTITVSIIMFFLGLQMLGVKGLQKFQFTPPKKITRFIADTNNFKTKWMPFIIGGLTFLLPCGFTVTSQSMALLSGSPLQGGLIMLSFALGTLPALLLIGLSSIKFTTKPHLSNQFLKIAGVLVLFFALYNFNAQLNVLGLKSLSDLGIFANQTQTDGFPAVVGGKQILKMDALSFAYEPNYFKVKPGIPVRWEITDKGTSGCTNAVISKGLFDGEIELTPGKVSTQEFTPQKPGKYKFSCWMGMVSGIIEVVDLSADSGQATDNPDTTIVDSGAQGCGGSGGGCTGGCGGGCGNPNCPYNK